MTVSMKWLRNLILEERAKKKIDERTDPKSSISGAEFHNVLEEEFKKYFVEDKLEEQGEVEIFELTARVTMRKEFNLEDIYTSIRAIEGVTIVSTEVETRDVGASMEKSVLKLKFSKARLSLRHYKILLYKHIMRVPGVVNTEFLTVKKIAREQ